MKQAKVIKIKNSCGNQGCEITKYTIPFGGKKVDFTPYVKKAA